MREPLDLDSLVALILRFRDARNREQFHNAKDLALALSIEATELNELFLWRRPDDADVGKLREELADILIFASGATTRTRTEKSDERTNHRSLASSNPGSA